MHSSRALQPDFVAGALLAALGGYVAWRAAGWDLMTDEGPGPGFFPLGYGVLMVGLSLALMLGALRRAPVDDAPAPSIFHGRALLTWAVFAGSALLMQRIGFLLGFAVLTLFMVRHVFRRSWTTAILVAIGCAAGFWLVFNQLLAVALPAGPWGF